MLDNASHNAEGHNPLCGDHISVAINLDKDCIEGISFQGESCAICKASSSMMTVAVKGKRRFEVEKLIQDFLSMATGKIDLKDVPSIGRLAVFAGISDLPTRVKCAILPWHTLYAAFNSVSSTSTEVNNDPMNVSVNNT